ncbi:carbohydrate ABC transporter permease [Pseudomonas sp. Marseille-QA0892]
MTTSATVDTPRPAARRWAWSRLELYGLLLLLPFMGLMFTFTHYPILASVWQSLHDEPRGDRAAEFVGLENFLYLLEDDVFITSLGNNLLYAAITVPVSIALAVLMALWVDRRLAGRAWVRMAFFMPAILPMIAIANLWLFIYTPQLGVLNRLLDLFGVAPVNWLGDPGTALYAMMAVTVWKEAGFFMIFYLAALQQIPPPLREAARLEGASRAQYFWRVQWPLLMPTTLFVAINALMNAFRVIDQVVVMTHGGPNNATSLLLFHLYRTAFSYWDLASAATMTVVLLLLLAVLALIKFGLLERRIHYQ